MKKLITMINLLIALIVHHLSVIIFSLFEDRENLVDDICAILCLTIHCFQYLRKIIVLQRIENWQIYQYFQNKKEISPIYNFKERTLFPQSRQIFIVSPIGFYQFYEFLQANTHLPRSLSYDMRFEICRLQSFKEAPPYANVYFIKLAKYGFYYDSNQNTCRCAFCSFEKNNWAENDNDVSDHHNENCPFADDAMPYNNVPMYQNAQSVSQAVAHHGYASTVQQINRGRILCGLTCPHNQVRSNPLQLTETANQSIDVDTSRQILDDRHARSDDLSDTYPTEHPDSAVTYSRGEDLPTNPMNNDDQSNEEQHTKRKTTFLQKSKHSSTNASESSAEQLTVMNYFPKQSNSDRFAKILGPKYPNYADKDLRLASFGSCPNFRPEIFADAGFFNTGNQDIVRCFHCGIGLRNWEEDDDPYVEHSRWSPNCQYIKNRKGQEFVDAVQEAVRKVQLEEALEQSKHKDENELDRAVKNFVAERQIKEQRICRICLDDEMSIVFLPCGHLVCCSKCAPAFKTCLICRKRIIDTVKVTV